MLRAFLLVMVCSLMSVQGIPQPGKPFMVRIGNRPVKVTAAKLAECKPIEQDIDLINLMKENDTTVAYYPQCIRLKRCSGCCLNPSQTCQPDKTKLKYFEVSVGKFERNGTRIFESRIISVSVHKSCKSACLMKKECGDDREFDEELCQCVCSNFDEKTKCLSDKKNRWNDENCGCEWNMQI